MGHKREPHDGAWMYISVPHSEELRDGIVEICRHHGWPVLAADDASAERRIMALRLADACILDVSAATVDAGAELALAMCEGRPVIALRSRTVDGTPFVDGLTRNHPAVRQVSYDALEDCLTELHHLFGDLLWQEEVARAAPRS